MTGEVAILNVSSGDTKLSFDSKSKADVKRARDTVADMLRRGFCILVEAGRDERGPLYRRVTKFDPKTDEYIIASTPEESASSAQVPSGAPPRASAGRQGRTRRVSAAKSTAVAVAPTSGG